MTNKLTGRGGCLRAFLRLNFTLEDNAMQLASALSLVSTSRRFAFTATLAIVTPALMVTKAAAAEPDVTFPAGYEQGKHYASIVRGETREELFTTPEAIASARRGDPLPEGTVITMEDYRDNKLYRYVVMEKRRGWGQTHPAELRTGNWEFQWFNPDRSVRKSENLDRCRACHSPQSGNDYVFSYDRMKEAD